MSSYSADTIRVLVATDNHVGYAEDDPIRGDDSWRTFEEIMQIAEDRDVDMVFLAGDLFHDHQPSQKSLQHVMASLRSHCHGDKPCAVELLSDESEHFQAPFNLANYNDPNLNIQIPVFSIHGNHDEPTGQASLASLDLLQTSGLINYFGRQREADKIIVRPLLFQKGTTKLAMYGLSNVRDERLFQTFRSHNVKFLQPGQMQDEWYNLLAVHQNHTAHTDESYLPEAFLPKFLDMVIWGHEHQCKIDPVENPSQGFKVIQPGSSIATSLSPSEAEPKHVCILNITARDCKVEPIFLKSVRPFLYKDISLAASKEMVAVAHKSDNLLQVRKYCKKIVEELIEKANAQWLSTHPPSDDDEPEVREPPKPLIRLRIECTAPPSGGDFKVEQARRFSKEFSGRVANDTDLFQFHKKRSLNKTGKATVDLPEAGDVNGDSQHTIKIADIVDKYIGAQDMTLLVTDFFEDAIGQFVEQNDKRALHLFVEDSLKEAVDRLLDDDEPDADADEMDDDRIMEARMRTVKIKVGEQYKRGEIQARSGLRTRPEDWDSDEDGHWADNAAANGEDDRMLLDSDAPSEAGSTARATSSRTKTGRKAPAKKKTAVPKKAPAKKVPTKKPAAKSRGKKKPIDEEDEDDDEEIILPDDSEDEDIEMLDHVPNGLFMSQASEAPRQAASRATSSRAKTAASKAAQSAASTQTRLNFGGAINGPGVRSTAARSTGTLAVSSRGAQPPPRAQEPVDDEISDGDDAFEPPAPSARTVRRR